jgi:hypothetical protein
MQLGVIELLDGDTLKRKTCTHCCSSFFLSAAIRDVCLILQAEDGADLPERYVNPILRRAVRARNLGE